MNEHHCHPPVSSSPLIRKSLKYFASIGSQKHLEGRFPKGQNEGPAAEWSQAGPRQVPGRPQAGPRQGRVISGSVLAKSIVPPQVMPVWETAPLLDLKLVIVEIWVGFVHQKGLCVLGMVLSW